MAWWPVKPYDGPNKHKKRPSPDAYETLKPAIEADKERRKEGKKHPASTKENEG